MTRAIIIMYQLGGINTIAKRQRIEASIEGRADAWLHHLRDAWLVISSDSVDEWMLRIRRQMNDKDQLLILDVNVLETEGLLTAEAWEWIRENMSVI